MKLPKVIIAVLGLHIGVIALFMFQAGCQTSKESLKRANPDAEIMDASTDSHHADLAMATSPRGLDSEFNAGMTKDFDMGPETGGERMPPTRPEKDMLLDADSNMQMADGDSTTAVNPAYRETVSYTVVSGDSAWKIANRNNITVADLLSANNLKSNSVLRPGQQLIIPVKAGTSMHSMVEPSGMKTVEQEVVSAGGGEYVVKSGDSLSKIAKKFNTSVSALQQVNALSGTNIQKGQTLKLPSGISGEKPAKSTSKPSASFSKQAAVSGNASHYEVAKGDTLGKIARMHNISVDTLMAQNGITDAKSLKIGQKLVVSGKGSVVETKQSQITTPQLLIPPSTTNNVEPKTLVEPGRAMTIGVIKTDSPEATPVESNEPVKAGDATPKQPEIFQNIDDIPTVEVEVVNE